MKAYIHAEREEDVRFEHRLVEVRVAPRFRRGASWAEEKVRLIKWALWQTNGNVSATADLIKVHRNAVGAMKKAGAGVSSERSASRRGARAASG